MDDFVHHGLVAMVIKLVYSVQFLYSTDQNMNNIQDFVIAHAVYLPRYSNGGKFVEESVVLDMVMGPGVAVTGDVIWDKSQVREGDQEKLRVQLGMFLSRSDVPPQHDVE